MVEYSDSSQLNAWLFQSRDELALCRSFANNKAKQHLLELQQQQKQSDNNKDGDNNNTNKTEPTVLVPVEGFGCGFSNKYRKGEIKDTGDGAVPINEDTKGHPYLSSEEEQFLVNFYVSKLPSLIGPQAQIPRLRRESKVVATSAMLLRRFYLSNSVMVHDPKTIMVGAAFLGSKVEDATADVRYLEEGTSLMNAPVSQSEIIPAEIALLEGTRFDLLCFHPYKAVQALTEDLRTYLKSDKGKMLVESVDNRPLSGQDLLPIYDTARLLLDDAIISDIPLLYNPGQVGLAALMVAQERVQQQQQQRQQQQQQQQEGGDNTDGLAPSTSTKTTIPRIDLKGYAKQRFEGEEGSTSSNVAEREKALLQSVDDICQMLRELKDGKHGCSGKYHTDMSALKSIHKKLKKVRLWGQKDGGKNKKKKTKKNKKEDGGGDDGQPNPKRQKT